MGDGELVKILDQLLCIEGARKAAMPLSQNHGYQENLKLNAVNAVAGPGGSYRLLMPRHIEYPDVLCTFNPASCSRNNRHRSVY